MYIKKYKEILQKTKLFKSFSEAELVKLFNEISYKIEKYSKNDIIFCEGDSCETLNLILEGTIEIQNLDAMGKVLSIAEFDSGDIFGEMLIFSDKNTYPITVIAKTDTSVLHMQKDALIKLCQSNIDFLYEYLRIISNKAVILNMKLKEVTLKTIRQKIAEFLIMQYGQQKSLSIKLGSTKKEWADKLGVQRPSLSRELIKMKEEGIIDYDKNIITITNLSDLENC